MIIHKFAPLGAGPVLVDAREQFVEVLLTRGVAEVRRTYGRPGDLERTYFWMMFARAACVRAPRRAEALVHARHVEEHLAVRRRRQDAHLEPRVDDATQTPKSSRVVLFITAALSAAAGLAVLHRLFQLLALEQDVEELVARRQGAHGAGVHGAGAAVNRWSRVAAPGKTPALLTIDGSRRAWEDPRDDGPATPAAAAQAASATQPASLSSC